MQNVNTSVVHILLKNTGAIFILYFFTSMNNDPTNNAMSRIDNIDAIIST